MGFREIEKSCEDCGATFVCGPDHETGDCWCDRLPPVLPPTPGLSCLCPRCLVATIRPHVERLIAVTPKSERRDNPKFTAHRRAGPPTEGLDFYRERGFTVFTEWFHLKRGRCCGNGCRHCPY